MQTCLELANTPNLDRMAQEGILGTVSTVPQDMEPSSACACMSITGYNPSVYYQGRSGIEAISMGYPISGDEVGFRCNLVTIEEGIMADYSAGHIGDHEARALIDAIRNSLGSDTISFYTGVGYRHLCKIKEDRETLQAICTPPHDIPNRPIDKHLPQGTGSARLRELMSQSVAVLRDHPINKARQSRGEPPANMIWLFWGSSQVPELPSFKAVYSLRAAMTSGVDLLNGLARMAQIEILNIPGVTDGADNDYTSQAEGAVDALEHSDLVFIHVESPDEAGHAGDIDGKINAIERIDKEMIGQLLSHKNERFRILAMPDHPTPIEIRTHTSDPVPFVIWGAGIQGNGAKAFSEKEAQSTGYSIKHGHEIMKRLVSE